MVVLVSNQRKFTKKDLLHYFAEWPNKDNIPDENGIVKDKLTMKLTPEIVFKIFRRISDDDVKFILVQFGLDLIG